MLTRGLEMVETAPFFPVAARLLFEITCGAFFQHTGLPLLLWGLNRTWWSNVVVGTFRSNSPKEPP